MPPRPVKGIALLYFVYLFTGTTLPITLMQVVVFCSEVVVDTVLALLMAGKV
jgi:hypothetical protein